MKQTHNKKNDVQWLTHKTLNLHISLNRFFDQCITHICTYLWQSTTTITYNNKKNELLKNMTCSIGKCHTIFAFPSSFSRLWWLWRLRGMWLWLRLSIWRCLLSVRQCLLSVARINLCLWAKHDASSLLFLFCSKENKKIDLKKSHDFSPNFFFRITFRFHF